MLRKLRLLRFKTFVLCLTLGVVAVSIVNIVITHLYSPNAEFVYRRGPGADDTHSADKILGKNEPMKWDLITLERNVESLLKRLPYNTTAVRRYRTDFNAKTQAYEIDGKPILWIYWDGPPKSAYIELCILTAVCHNYGDFDIRVLNDTEFISTVGWVHPAYKFLTSNHKSDYFRMAVLHLYGGVYHDADTISFESMRELYKLLSDYDIVGPSARDGVLHFSNIGPIRANTTFSREWKSRLLEKLDEKFKTPHRGDPFQWIEIGGGLAVPVFERLLRENRTQHYGFSGAKTWLQFQVEDVISENRDLLRNLNKTEILVLNNRLFPYMYRRMTMRGVLRSKRGVSQLIRYSLINCLKKVSLDPNLAHTLHLP
ncbi:uncharacterized protein LOC106174800 [Lingula anatina]|uniref:Uncharacterized protein LOC106174800 n=1 Tax=Lingula anatina TaxID=7574 RepID=A0A1S3JNK0_LINAN|nr:uncharacterized protein LOC106174800 [Lingula anatina]|eukprot:XP_013411945.1 uncharacterized protein LOC106174800 [Lingula anatina]